MGRSAKVKAKGIFVTATDTEVGKTVTSLALGLLLQKAGVDVGVMKPVQCSGDDAEFLKQNLKLNDDIKDINPFYASRPLSPHIAFSLQKESISIPKIIKSYETLTQRHEFVIVEGAGGLMVPLKNNYMMIDLIRELDLDVVIVSRLGLGTINHTLLSIEMLRQYGVNVAGVIFNEQTKSKKGKAEQTNPDAIAKFGKVPIIGTIPYLSKLEPKTILQKTQACLDYKKIYNPKSKRRTKVLQEADKNFVWHPFTQMKDWMEEDPLVIDQAKGNYLIDTDGNKYLDGVSSLWVNVHGHRNKEIDGAIKKQIDQLSHSTLLGLTNTPAVELAKELVNITPKGLDKVFYSDSGSTAVEIAVKMAYQYWQNIGKTQKTRLVHLTDSYHGDTLGSVSVGGIELFHKVYRDLVIETIQMELDVERIEELLKTEHQNIAALVVEPLIQGAAGMLIWPDGVLRQLSKLCQKYKVIFITDEVATGFGRTGKMFACEHEGVTPDILCLAKGITGGYLPLAATLTTKKIFDGFVFDYKDQKTFFHGHTYTGNPLCCAAALASLKIFQKERVLEKLAPKIKFLSKGLKMFYNLASVGDVRHKGLMVGIELVRDKSTNEPFPWQDKIGVQVCQEVRKYGVILRPLGNVIVIMPPLSITKQELTKILDVTYDAINKITNKYYD